MDINEIHRPDFDSIPEVKFHRKATLIRVVDGDTLDVEIDLGWSLKIKERLRLELVDTPEIKSKTENQAGKLVKSIVQKWLGENPPLIITSVAYDRTGKVRGKYGRTLAHVFHAEEKWSLNRRLLQEKLAWATNEKGDIIGERDLSLLTGLNDVQTNP